MEQQQEEIMKNSRTDKNFKLVLTALLAAIIVVFTVVPYTGYISYGGVLEITTLHMVVILGAVLIGPASGAALGGVWGITCMLRALTNPLWAPFVNPLVSLVPRVLVGLVSGAVFAGLMKLFSKKSSSPADGENASDNKKAKKGVKTTVAAELAVISGTLTNTILVLITYNYFAGMMQSYAAVYEVFKGIFNTIIGLNFVVETVLAAVIIPILYSVLKSVYDRRISK